MRETGRRESELAEMLIQRREEFIDRWMERFQSRLGPDVAPPMNALDSVPAFLDDIVAQLTEPLDELEASARRLSGAHGRHRFFAGTDLPTLVLEFETILDVVVDMVFDYGPKVHIAAWHRLYRWLFSGIKEAIDAYTAARDRQIEEQTSEHLSFLAHELRNPVTTLSLALQILQGRLPPADLRTAEVMHSNLERITDLIDQQLVSLRLQTGVPIRPLDLDVSEVLNYVATALESNAESKRQRIRVEAEPGLLLWGDPRLIRSVLTNLLGNAIKFSPEGATIVLRARDTGSHVALGVEDECGGIPEGAMKEIFEPFVQAGTDRSGHGLGLAIVRQAVEAHHGELEVRNMPGKGCELTASFPVRPAAPAPGPAAPPPPA